MSRIGKQAIAIPKSVTVTQPSPRLVKVKGPKGELTLSFSDQVRLVLSDGSLAVERQNESRQARMDHGSVRAHIRNMVEGVTKGYEKNLEVVGVGWNAAVVKGHVQLTVGYCKPVEIPIPEGVMAACPSPTAILVTGADVQAVGQLAARLRQARPPEPYKGKGVRFKGEVVRQKQGKTFGS
jgi:large subunit ribosomal protein L6